ncbi:MAG: TetR/AcrR family transcriptional regulator [Planctomycetia bacterium]|nr:TetR/AcrR family transcriptional regulator [Planctomycetia bacterium]
MSSSGINPLKVSEPTTIAAVPEESSRRAERRLAIVEAAAKQFAAHGYNDCDMECVAVKAGIGKGTLYLYFPGKQELFFACVDLGMKQMQAAVRAAAETVSEPFQKIDEAIRAYLKFFDEHPEHVELLIQERAIFRDRVRPTYFEYRDANRGPWRQLYVELAAAGRLRTDIAIERILDTVGSLLYGTMFTNHFIGRTITLEEQHQAILAVTLRGISPAGR